MKPYQRTPWRLGAQDLRGNVDILDSHGDLVARVSEVTEINTMGGGTVIPKAGPDRATLLVESVNAATAPAKTFDWVPHLYEVGGPTIRKAHEIEATRARLAKELDALKVREQEFEADIAAWWTPEEIEEAKRFTAQK